MVLDILKKGEEKTREQESARDIKDDQRLIEALKSLREVFFFLCMCMSRSSFEDKEFQFYLE